MQAWVLTADWPFTVWLLYHLPKNKQVEQIIPKLLIEMLLPTLKGMD